MSKKILLAGESWLSHTTHVKGFDTFNTAVYETGEKWLKEALEKGGYTVEFLPNHLAGEQFPYTMDELNQYDCVILSDIGSNTLLLPQETFNSSVRKPNRCNLLKDYVLQGGSLLMVGGYLTFSGVDAKGRWAMTAVQDVLPVEVMTIDDRMEHCEGVFPSVVSDDDILSGIPKEWPYLLGYNKTKATMDSTTLVSIDGDPLIAVQKFGDGRSAVFTSDCAPHWCPPEFLEWEGYVPMWNNLLDWLTE
jgi:uncharacterized membrane protein